ncbi:MAG: cyclase family protein [Patescibacteria group bacterium]
MKIVDLSVTVDQDTPAYPGDPKINIEQIGDFDAVGYNDHQVTFGIHSSGTHIDAPWHMVKDGKKLDELAVEQFVGRGRYVKAAMIDLEVIKQADIEEGDIVLLDTGMGNVYGQDEYYTGYRPVMSEEIAEYLVSKKIKMVGVDMCSPDQEPFAVHRILLGAGVLIIENMTNLSQLEGQDFTVYALPTKLRLDGAPARVIAVIN